ncbi:MAG: hypothetical protein KGL32_01250 [candidate division NC10 bacterium]|nr:hypothetical protein [candidate division NC10 bacterium]
MTATALLTELKQHGVILHPKGDRLAFGPTEKVTPELRDKIVRHKVDLLRLLQPDPTLAEAYRRYWSLPESESMEVFQAAYREIIRLEAQADPQTAWRTLREAAAAWHTETGVCPFCRELGELHLPAQEMERELSR